jgi:hypothetical protein
MAGLLARGSLPSAAFPVAQWRNWRAARRLQLRGQPWHWPLAASRVMASPCSLLIPEGNHLRQRCRGSGQPVNINGKQCAVRYAAGRLKSWVQFGNFIARERAVHWPAPEDPHETRSDLHALRRRRPHVAWRRSAIAKVSRARRSLWQRRRSELDLGVALLHIEDHDICDVLSRVLRSRRCALPNGR